MLESVRHLFIRLGFSLNLGFLNSYSDWAHWGSDSHLSLDSHLDLF